MTQTSSGEAGGEPYDHRHLARLFIGSFRFSQGRPELQVQILAHLVGRYGGRMRRELLPVATEQATPTLLRVVGNHRLHGPVADADSRELIAAQAAAFDRLLAAAVVPPVDPLDLAVGMAEADLAYLGRPAGRPRSGEVDTGGSSWVDRWTGLLAFHAVLGRSAGLAEFDAMFEAISRAVREAPELPPVVRDAVARHFAQHPEDRSDGTNQDEKISKDP